MSLLKKSVSRLSTRQTSLSLVFGLRQGFVCIKACIYEASNYQQTRNKSPASAVIIHSEKCMAN